LVEVEEAVEKVKLQMVTVVEAVAVEASKVIGLVDQALLVREMRVDGLVQVII
jgi:hypothetical protein